jgi:hypothetical protein
VRPFGVAKRDILTQRRIEHIGQEPWEGALASEMAELLDSEIELVVLGQHLLAHSMPLLL